MKLFKMTKTKNVAETLNNFFENAVSSLKLNENSFIINKEHKHSGSNWKDYCKISISPQYFN